jgi:hypothetical protein
LTSFTTLSLWRRSRRIRQELSGIRSRGLPSGGPWYPYDVFGNCKRLCRLLGLCFDIGALMGDLPVADIGCADGDFSFLLSAMGCPVHAFDNPGTNCNRMTGALELKSALASPVQVLAVDIDREMRLPGGHQYGLAFFMGTLYHVKNPFHVLEMIREQAQNCILSTRIAQTTPDRLTRIEGSPLAYLLDARECNDDVTNYWIFGYQGLLRLLSRCGWRVRATYRHGTRHDSDPTRADERVHLHVVRA